MTVALVCALALGVGPVNPAARAQPTADDVADDGQVQPTGVAAGGVVRYAGADRFATAAVLSASAFDPGVDVAYVATGADFPDALAGGVAAAADGGPMLLVAHDSVPSATAEELERLSPARIVVLGGEAVVSPDVEAALASFTTGSVDRLAGPDRFATAAAVSRALFPDGAERVYLAVGSDFPDALAGVPAAVWHDAPVLLVGATDVPAATREELIRLQASEAVLLGGSTVITDEVETAVADLAGSVSRIAGADRVRTAALVSATTFPARPAVYVATAGDFPDALAAGTVAGARSAPVLLVGGGVVDAAVLDEVCRLRPAEVVIAGGTSAVSDAAAATIRDRLGSCTSQGVVETSQDLIGMALHRGDITRPEAVAYRVLALFGDERLPPQLLGDGAGGHDPMAITDARAALDDMPADLRTAVAPLLRRPPDPASAFSGDAAAAFAQTDGTRARCTDGWVNQTGTHEFRVWACDTGDAAADIGAAVDLLDSVWAEMTRPLPDGLGPPKPDDDGSGPEIDVYLMAPDMLGPSRDRFADPLEFPDGVTAAAEITAAGDDTSASGYLLLNRGQIGDDDDLFALSVVHELFHILQLRHNSRPAGDALWFFEAMATWAEAHYLPHLSGRVAQETFVDATHSMRRRSEPLFAYRAGANVTNPAYGAYMWPLFMEQQIDATAVFGAWARLAGLTDGEAQIAAIGAELPFADHFHEFAVRNVNLALAGEPISPRYVDLDPDFPDDTGPPFAELGRMHEQDAEDPRRYLIPLMDRFTGTSRRIDLTGAAEENRLDLVPLPAPGSAPVRIEALLRRADDGQWQRVRVDHEMAFCGIDELILVTSNVSAVPALAHGDIEVDATLPCSPASGTITTTWTEQSTGSHGTVFETWTATIWLQLGPPERHSPSTDDHSYPDAGSTWALHGNSDWEQSGCGFTHLTWEGSGHVVDDSVHAFVGVEDGVPYVDAGATVTETAIGGGCGVGSRTDVRTHAFNMTCDSEGNHLSVGVTHGRFVDEERRHMVFDCVDEWQRPLDGGDGSLTGSIRTTGEIVVSR